MLVRLQGTSRALRPAAAGLRASAPGLAATLRALPGFADAARPTLRTARAVAPTLSRLGRRATPVVRRLRPVAGELDAFARALDPVSGPLDAGVGDLLGFWEGWARAIQMGDGPGHTFRNQLVLSPELVTRLQRSYIDRADTRRLPAALPSVTSAPRPSLPLPPVRLPRLPEIKLPRVPDVHLPHVERRIGELADGLGTAVKGHGGEPAHDRSRLLDFLLAP
jgi:hypothetical protein